LGGISGLISVIILVRHRSKDKKETRIQLFLDKYQRTYVSGGHFLDLLIPSGINLLKDDSEIKRVLDSLQSIYHTHPLRDWNTKVESIGYKKFFKYVVGKTSKLNKNNIDDFISAVS
jgi:hypothetical protein